MVFFLIKNKTKQFFCFKHVFFLFFIVFLLLFIAFMLLPIFPYSDARRACKIQALPLFRRKVGCVGRNEPPPVCEASAGLSSLHVLQEIFFSQYYIAVLTEFHHIFFHIFPDLGVLHVSAKREYASTRKLGVHDSLETL